MARTSLSGLAVSRLSTGIQSGYLSGSSFVKLARTGVPLCATTAIPNEPACPPRPEPSS